MEGGPLVKTNQVDSPNRRMMPKSESNCLKSRDYEKDYVNR